MRVIVNRADSLKESPASPAFVSHRTGTENNENSIAQQESNEIRRGELAEKSQITRFQPIKIGRDSWILPDAIERPKPDRGRPQRYRSSRLKPPGLRGRPVPPPE